MSQISIPIPVNLEAIKVRKTLGAAIAECIDLSGLEVKQLPFDKAQWSRWESGAEGIVWPKFTALMSLCRNDAPLLWMVNDCGYDLHSLRRTETENERKVRMLEEENAALRRLLRGN